MAAEGNRGRLWIVAPVYYDARPFVRVRAEVRGLVDRDPALSGLEPRFVVLDDSGGQDSEVSLLREFDDVLVIESPFNLGHQRGLVYALRKLAPGLESDDLVVTMDSDGEDRPEDLPRLLSPLTSFDSGPSIVLAKRTQRRISFGFKLLYVGFRLMFRALTGRTVRSGNYAAFRGRVAKRILPHPAFDLSYSSTLLSLGLPLAFVPCARGERYEGDSRMGRERLFIHGLRMLMPFADRIATRALILFATIVAVSFALMLAVVAVKVFTDEAIPGWATFTLLGVLTLSVVALGNFVTLFTVFSQSRAISLANLEQEEAVSERESAGIAPGAAD